MLAAFPDNPPVRLKLDENKRSSEEMSLRKCVEPALAIVKVCRDIVPYSSYAQALNGEDISRESYFPMVILTVIQRINSRTPGRH